MVRWIEQYYLAWAALPVNAFAVVCSSPNTLTCTWVIVFFFLSLKFVTAMQKCRMTKPPVTLVCQPWPSTLTPADAVRICHAEEVVSFTSSNINSPAHTVNAVRKSQYQRAKQNAGGSQQSSSSSSGEPPKTAKPAITPQLWPHSSHWVTMPGQG